MSHIPDCKDISFTREATESSGFWYGMAAIPFAALCDKNSAILMTLAGVSKSVSKVLTGVVLDHVAEINALSVKVLDRMILNEIPGEIGEVARIEIFLQTTVALISAVAFLVFVGIPLEPLMILLVTVGLMLPGLYETKQTVEKELESSTVDNFQDKIADYPELAPEMVAARLAQEKSYEFLNYLATFLPLLLGEKLAVYWVLAGVASMVNAHAVNYLTSAMIDHKIVAEDYTFVGVTLISSATLNTITTVAFVVLSSLHMSTSAVLIVVGACMMPTVYELTYILLTSEFMGKMAVNMARFYKDFEIPPHSDQNKPKA